MINYLKHRLLLFDEANIRVYHSCRTKLKGLKRNVDESDIEVSTLNLASSLLSVLGMEKIMRTQECSITLLSLLEARRNEMDDKC